MPVTDGTRGLLEDDGRQRKRGTKKKVEMIRGGGGGRIENG